MTKRKTYEYMVLTWWLNAGASDREENLAEWTPDGWRLVSVCSESDGSALAYLEREVVVSRRR